MAVRRWLVLYARGWLRRAVLAGALFLIAWGLALAPGYGRDVRRSLAFALAKDADWRTAADRVAGAVARWATTVGRTVPVLGGDLRGPGRGGAPPLLAPVPGPILLPYRDPAHRGVDLAAVTGEPVRAMADGRVVRVAAAPDHRGRYVLVEHGSGGRAVYGHLDAVFVRAGQRVARGQVIGRAAPGPRARSSWIHLEWLSDRGAVDPAPLLPTVRR